MDIASYPRTVSIAFLLGIGLPGLTSFCATDWALAHREFLSGQYQRAVETDFTSNIPFMDAARGMYTAANLVVFGQAHPEVVVAGQDWLFTAEEFREPDGDVDFLEELDTARLALSVHGIRLVPVIVPDKARVYSDLLPHSRAEEIDDRYEAALSLLSAEGFPAIDLRAVLVAGRAGGETFMRTDTHWSPHGAQLAAEAVAVSLGARGSATFETIVGPTQPFRGDLASFVDTGHLSDWVGPQPETIAIPETISASDGLGLFGDAQIDLVLVGTSFSARTDFNFPGFLEAATGFDLVSFAIEGRGPFDPMRDLLSGSALTDIQPRIVIWEIPERYIPTRRLP